MMILLGLLSVFGSLASIAGLAFSVYIYKKEKAIEADVVGLKSEEERWHQDRIKGRIA